jgi:hypothetical protein
MGSAHQGPPKYPQGQPQNVSRPTNRTFAHVAQEGHSQYDNGLATGCYSSLMSSIGSCIGFLGSIPCCFCCPNPYRTFAGVLLFHDFGLKVRFNRARLACLPVSGATPKPLTLGYTMSI